MDGSDVSIIVSSLDRPISVIDDYDASRLYWADHGANRTQSSNLAGGDIRTVIQLLTSTKPEGLAQHGNKLYWGNYATKSLQSSTKTGENVRTLNSSVQPLTVATKNLSRARRNDCEGQACSGICVLTAKPFRCLPRPSKTAKNPN